MSTLRIVDCGLRIVAAALVICSSAAAGEIKLDLRNPAIDKLHARMQAHAAKLAQWKNAGDVGEAETGLLEARPVAGRSIVEKKELRDLVAAENEDRRALFRELALANTLGADDLAAVAAAYARAQQQAAAPKQWIHTSEGWKQK